MTVYRDRNDVRKITFRSPNFSANRFDIFVEMSPNVLDFFFNNLIQFLANNSRFSFHVHTADRKYVDCRLQRGADVSASSKHVAGNLLLFTQDLIERAFSFNLYGPFAQLRKIRRYEAFRQLSAVRRPPKFQISWICWNFKQTSCNSSPVQIFWCLMLLPTVSVARQIFRILR